MSLPGYTYQCALKETDHKLLLLRNNDLVLLLENNIPRGTSSVMGQRYVISDDNKKILKVDANNLYGHSMYRVLTGDVVER